MRASGAVRGTGNETMHYNTNIPVPSLNGTGLMNQGGGIVPPALLEESRVPRFYQEAIASCGAVSPSQLPNTALVYNLMVTSRLPRPVLGNIWSLVNRTLPGQLTRQEFFSCLALIALAQRGQSLSALSNVSLLPIPHLQACLPVPSQPCQEGEPRDHEVVVLCPSATPAPSTRTLPVQLAPHKPSLPHPSIPIRPLSTTVPLTSPPSSSNTAPLPRPPMPKTTTPSPINFANFEKCSTSGAFDRGGAGGVRKEVVPSYGVVGAQAALPSYQSSSPSSEGIPLQCSSHPPLLPLPLTAAAQQQDNQEVNDVYAAVKAVGGSDSAQQGGECVRVWERCIEEACSVMREADRMLSSFPPDSVREVARTERGAHYLSALYAVHQMTDRFDCSTNSEDTVRCCTAPLTNVCSSNSLYVGTQAEGNEAQVQRIRRGRGGDVRGVEREVDEVDRVWGRVGEWVENAEQKEECVNGTVPHRCGVCLTDIGSRDLLQFAGRAYHRQCANLWINRIDSLLP